ncbi:MAG: 4-hydroxy-tetrahydrodipicolinate synthase [Candidatus Sumerlaeia bacterium]|nr:4-hydroxy-tetrahydrodipicolinate synthase [Candidatus Sumerlaeia bacterium]
MSLETEMETAPLAGNFVALVTPFTAEDRVDEAALARLVEYVIDGGVDGIVPCGTTGEKSTLTVEEHKRVIERVVELVAGRVQVIAGSGSNDTRHAIEMARFAREVGADASLSEVPYYNRPTQEGLIRHFCAIAERAEIPMIVYNIPSRAGTRINADTLLRLAHMCPWIQGVKDATKDLDFTAEVLRGRPDGFRVLSGDDSATLAMIAMGGDGVISVVANEVPDRFSEMVHAAMRNEFERAREIYFELLPLMTANFLETNPIPVKAALAMMGLIEPHIRLPLTPMSPGPREKLRQVLAALNLLPPTAEK